MPLALGIVTLFAIGSVGTGSGDEPGPIGPIGLVSGAVGATPPGNAADRTATSAAGTPILTAPDARLALPGGAPPISGLSGYRWPLPKGRLTQDYGPTTFASRVVNGQPFHDGIDLATFCGDRIVAAHDGVVLAASRHFDDVIGWVGSLDRYYKRLDTKKLWMTLPIVVVIDDGNGYRSMYAHFEEVVGQARPARPCRPIPGLRGPYRERVGLPPALRLVQPLRAQRDRHRPGSRQADEAAARRDRPGRSARWSCRRARSRGPSRILQVQVETP